MELDLQFGIIVLTRRSELINWENVPEKEGCSFPTY